MGMLDSRGQYFEVTDEQAHDGKHSFVTRGEAAKKSWIFKKFDSAVNGKVSVWFYDTMGDKGKESFQQVNIWAPFSKVSEQPAITGLGTDGKTKLCDSVRDLFRLYAINSEAESRLATNLSLT